ncbi:MAG TPA: VWA domain-containing protein [Vicinamibacterales bacterium]|nr:VWA domain-containing protein [Vicinamibacterales bacterium]
MRFRASLLIAGLATIALAAPGLNAQEGFRFKSGVDLVNVTATVTDDNGRFVSGLDKQDFTIFDDGKPQPITHFNSDRVPVSLGILLDTSGSMKADKMTAARAAIDRFITTLLAPDDELFFVEFADNVDVRQEWTTDREAISRAVRRVDADGGTALYDAVAQSLPLAAGGKHRKKALLVISDGNDSRSLTTAFDLRQKIRESEVLVYALGVDGRAAQTTPAPRNRTPTRPPFPLPTPGIPGIGRPRTFPQLGTGGGLFGVDERVNPMALRAMTDDTGGRTEIIRELRDLDAATARIADELSKQYSLGYVAPGEHDGRWHAIRVEVRDRNLTVRARRGYVAS